MSKYIVRDVVCDWGIYLVDDLGKEELVEVFNSKSNAELICEILSADLMKDGKYTIWKDKKITDLETKLAECQKENEQLNKIKAEKEAINFLLMQALKLACKTLHNVCITQNYMLGLGQDENYFINKGLENIRKELKK